MMELLRENVLSWSAFSAFLVILLSLPFVQVFEKA